MITVNYDMIDAFKKYFIYCQVSYKLWSRMFSKTYKTMVNKIK